MKVLVCEDSISTRQVLGAFLQQMGHLPIYAENGTQAIDLFMKHQPDMVVIDVEMPEMDGYEATRAIRQSSKDFAKWTPIIFVSSYIDDESIIKGIESGADDYLTKPVTATVLRAKIHSMRRLAMMRENLIDFGKQLREVNEKLLHSNQLWADLSLKDPLTLLANRRAFEETFARISRTAIREKQPLSLLMIDVDNFKSFNDTYGHQAGDECLQQIAHVLKKGIHRAEDVASRFGGEEFTILLADTTLAGAMHVAERIRLGVEVLQMQNKNSFHGIITISIGVATTKTDTPFINESLLAAADTALYDAKQAGRNCIRSAKSAVDTRTAEQLAKYKIQRFPSDGSDSNSKH